MSDSFPTGLVTMIESFYDKSSTKLYSKLLQLLENLPKFLLNFLLQIYFLKNFCERGLKNPNSVFESPFYESIHYCKAIDATDKIAQPNAILNYPRGACVCSHPIISDLYPIMSMR